MLNNLTQPHEYPGRLFVVEGIDGSGKDRQAKLLIERLIAEGRHVVASQEPNEATPIGQLLRKLLRRQWHATLVKRDHPACLG